MGDSDKRRLILWKSKLTEEPLPRRLIPLPSLEEREPPVLSRDSVSTDFQERPIEVSERLPVSVLGIHLPLSGLLLELVIKVTSTELKSTKRYTELEPVLPEELPTTPLL